MGLSFHAIIMIARRWLGIAPKSKANVTGVRSEPTHFSGLSKF